MKSSQTIPQVLTIAGSDSGGGAGIQADLKTFQERDVYGLSVITAVTAQNTRGVTDIQTISVDTIVAQLDAVLNDFSISACKLGMLGGAETVMAIADYLATAQIQHCVIDPVMVATSGDVLLPKTAIAALKTALIPLADVLTPNLAEAACLTGLTLDSPAAIDAAAKKLQALGAKTVIIKGGHSDDNQCVDYVYLPDKQLTLRANRINTRHTHGTGCTFSACIAAELAKSHDLVRSIHTAKAFITAAISQPLGIGHGHGPTNHWAYRKMNDRCGS